MIKELYQETTKELALTITQSKVDAIMKKTITKSGCRVYDNGFIGIAGTLGEPIEETWEKAIANLSKKLSYPFEPEKNSKRVRDLREIDCSDEDFVRNIEKILEEVQQDYREFILSNKIKLVESEITLQNDAGLHYINLDKTIEILILVKHKDSVNIFDTGIPFVARNINYDEIKSAIVSVLKAQGNPLQLPLKEKMPIIIDEDIMVSKIVESLDGKSVGRNTSIFNNKIGNQIFNTSFDLVQDRSDAKYHVPFFDKEGVTNEGDRYKLIENGMLMSTYTDKKYANEYKYKLTGAAEGAYDEVPSLAGPYVSILPSNRTLKELLQGELGIFVIQASGGDYTDDGNFASPVQTAYLTDGEQLLGLLPEFNVSGNLYEIFGADYVGVSSDKTILGIHSFVMKLKIN